MVEARNPMNAMLLSFVTAALEWLNVLVDIQYVTISTLWTLNIENVSPLGCHL
jgi:hypothetical protein